MNSKLTEFLFCGAGSLFRSCYFTTI